MKILKRIRNKFPTLKFKWPLPLTPINKIKNLKAYRDYHHCGLSDAKEAVEKAMPTPQRPAFHDIPIF